MLLLIVLILRITPTLTLRLKAYPATRVHVCSLRSLTFIRVAPVLAAIKLTLLLACILIVTPLRLAGRADAGHAHREVWRAHDAVRSRGGAGVSS